MVYKSHLLSLDASVTELMANGRDLATAITELQRAMFDGAIRLVDMNAMAVTMRIAKHADDTAAYPAPPEQSTIVAWTMDMLSAFVDGRRGRRVTLMHGVPQYLQNVFIERQQFEAVFLGKLRPLGPRKKSTPTMAEIERFPRQFIDSEIAEKRTPSLTGMRAAWAEKHGAAGRDKLDAAYHKHMQSLGLEVKAGHPKKSAT